MADAAVAVYALDVGQGDCTFVVAREPRDGVVLFDCNDPYVAERFVVDHGIETLHAVVISHLDRDHIRGMLPFMRWFLSDAGRKIHHVYVGLDRDRKAVGQTAGELIDALLAWREPHGLLLHAPQREDTPRAVWEFGPWSAQLVLPRYDDLLEAEMVADDEPNRCSVVLRVVCGGQAVLVGGDAPLVCWERLEPSVDDAAREEVVQASAEGVAEGRGTRKRRVATEVLGPLFEQSTGAGGTVVRDEGQ